MAGHAIACLTLFLIAQENGSSLIWRVAKSIPLVVDRTLRLLEAVIADRGASSITDVAAQVRVPKATAYRLCAALVERGYIVRICGGRYYPGSTLLAAISDDDERLRLVRAAKPCLDWVAHRLGAFSHLGVFEGGMVSYLLKSGSGPSGRFTRAGSQLDAYCSALGKVLLAHLPKAARDSYLADGPFPRLTSHTIVDPKELSVHLQDVRKQSYAVDDREFADELKCLAVPIRDRTSNVCAALSVTTRPESLDGARLSQALRILRRAARDTEISLHGRRS